MTKTESVLIKMLKENTGKSLCDSGGAYGRHWESNQLREFLSEKPTILKFKDWNDGEIEITHNVFHWLNERVEYNTEFNRLFNQWTNKEENKDCHWLELMESFPKYLRTKKGKQFEVSGVYGENEPFSENTYNGSDLLSQTLQYTYMCVKSTDKDIWQEIVLLQIHNGCDVRGGYTKPIAFRLKEKLSIFNNSNATVYCSNCGGNWFTDDGYHFYENGSTREKELQNYEFIEVDNAPESLARVPSMLQDGDTCLSGNYEHKGKVAFDDEGNGYCPNCGGKLEGGY